MMWLFTFTAARTALTYITVGALTVIWAGVWYAYLYNNPPVTQAAYYWCSGFLVTGLALSVIGAVLSFVNRAGEQATLPVAVVTVQTNPTTTAGPALAPIVAPNGQVVVAAPKEIASR